ncbi:DBH-like monooxygenase protein 1 homolog [Mytilus californianus]|uniref:DBH-like monooxygenase protein 1 homolog n=1 Tax=Mytilus californianus TaxID=6549 RepID=UPI0022481D88|nr:DBH-like monooxygenase protein 1 homolog [Mytilus californianus]
MFPSDVVMGWVKNGNVHFADYHTTEHSAPVKDRSQDYILLNGEENDFGTVLKFVRKLDTCDENDYKISDDTVRIIYAHSEDDPNDENDLRWHGTEGRGVKFMYLLNAVTKPDLSGNIITRDMTQTNYHVPPQVTTYRCKAFTLSDLGKKHHMIKFESHIQRGMEPFVHHILVYKCPPLTKEWINKDYFCYLNGREVAPCGSVFFGWEYGGQDFYFPDNVGMPIGEPEDDATYIMEVHYNNPEMRSDLVDSSGMRITFTPDLRKYDAGLLTTGVQIGPTHMIPPHETDFVNTGFCQAECLEQGLKDMPGQQVKVFAAWQHSHLLAYAMTTKHLRNGKEIEPFADDQAYDFNYQQIRLLRKEVPLKMGDSLITQCTYDSTSRTNLTLGGEATTDEMCISFIFYYPRMPLDGCLADPIFDTIPEIKDMKPPEQVKFLQGYNWKDRHARLLFRNNMEKTKYRSSCYARNPSFLNFKTVDRLRPTEVYHPPQRDCKKDSDQV